MYDIAFLESFLKLDGFKNQPLGNRLFWIAVYPIVLSLSGFYVIGCFLQALIEVAQKK